MRSLLPRSRQVKWQLSDLRKSSSSEKSDPLFICNFRCVKWGKAERPNSWSKIRVSSLIVLSLYFRWRELTKSLLRSKRMRKIFEQKEEFLDKLMNPICRRPLLKTAIFLSFFLILSLSYYAVDIFFQSIAKPYSNLSCLYGLR